MVVVVLDRLKRRIKGPRNNQSSRRSQAHQFRDAPRDVPIRARLKAHTHTRGSARAGLELRGGQMIIFAEALWSRDHWRAIWRHSHHCNVVQKAP